MSRGLRSGTPHTAHAQKCQRGQAPQAIRYGACNAAPRNRAEATQRGACHWVCASVERLTRRTHRNLSVVKLPKLVGIAPSSWNLETSLQERNAARFSAAAHKHKARAAHAQLSDDAGSFVARHPLEITIAGCCACRGRNPTCFRCPAGSIRGIVKVTQHSARSCIVGGGACQNDSWWRRRSRWWQRVRRRRRWRRRR